MSIQTSEISAHLCAVTLKFVRGSGYALLNGAAEETDEAFTGVRASAKHRQKAELSSWPSQCLPLVHLQCNGAWGERKMARD